MTRPAALVLAADLGGTNIRAAAVGPDGRVAARASAPTPARDGAEAVVEALARACEAVAARAALDGGAPVGLCAPGPLDAATGRTMGTPTIDGFEDFPLAGALGRRLGRPVVLDNDGHAAAWGEWHHGAARGETDFAFVTVSTGIGGAAVCDGRLVRGRRGLAGHFGHLPVGRGGHPCVCGQPDCWESVASGTALQRRAREAGFASLPDVFARHAHGHAGATALIEGAAADLAHGLSAIVHAFSPSVVVLGGGVMAHFDVLAPRIRRSLEARLLPAFRGVVLRRAALGDDAGLVGMAARLSVPAPDL